MERTFTVLGYMRTIITTYRGELKVKIRDSSVVLESYCHYAFRAGEGSPDGLGLENKAFLRGSRQLREVDPKHGLLYSVKNDRFGTTFNPAKRASPSSSTALMTWLCRALPKSFSADSDRTAHAAGTIVEPGKPPPRGACPGRPRSARAGTGTDLRTWYGSGVVSDRADGRRSHRPRRDGSGWAVRRRLVAAASRTLFLKDHGDRRLAERLTFTSESAADVLDGEILLPQGDNLFSKPFLFAGWLTSACGGDEEVAFELIAELMDQDAKAARRRAEPPGGFGGGDTLDEEGSECLVLSVVGVGWLQEQASQV